MAYNPDIVGAYRQATGIAYKEGLEKARQEYQQLPFMKKLRHHFDPFWDTEYGLSEGNYWMLQGKERLKTLISQETGYRYPRGEITYRIDGSYGRQTFAYSLIFRGKQIGEEGQVELSYRPRQVLLSKGKLPFVEISEKGEHVLQLMPREGISLQPNLEATIASWAPSGRRIVLATWFPVLSDEPKPFEYPKGGKFVWNAASS